MKKSIKYSSMIAAALLATAPVISSVVPINNTVEALTTAAGDSQENPIKITYKVGQIEDEKPTLKMIISYKKGINSRLIIPVYLYENGKLVDGIYFAPAWGTTVLSSSEYGSNITFTYPGYYTPGGYGVVPDINLNSLNSLTDHQAKIFKPNTWYEINGKALQTTKDLLFEPSSDAFLNTKTAFKIPNPKKGSNVTLKNSDILTPVDNNNHLPDSTKGPKPGKDGDKLVGSDSKTTSDNPTQNNKSGDTNQSNLDNNGNSSITINNTSSLNTGNDSTETGNNGQTSNNSIADQTTDADQTTEDDSTKGNNGSTARKTSATKYYYGTVVHKSYAYNKKGEAIKKNGKHVVYKKGSKLKLMNEGKFVTIKGKKFYQVSKKRYVKAVNITTAATKVNVKATVKGKKNAKIRTYTSNGKRTKKYVYGKKTYKLNGKKAIKGKTYYKIYGKNQWIPANKLNLKK